MTTRRRMLVQSAAFALLPGRALLAQRSRAIKLAFRRAGKFLLSSRVQAVLFLAQLGFEAGKAIYGLFDKPGAGEPVNTPGIDDREEGPAPHPDQPDADVPRQGPAPEPASPPLPQPSHPPSEMPAVGRARPDTEPSVTRSSVSIDPDDIVPGKVLRIRYSQLIEQDELILDAQRGLVLRVEESGRLRFPINVYSGYATVSYDLSFRIWTDLDELALCIVHDNDETLILQCDCVSGRKALEILFPGGRVEA